MHDRDTTPLLRLHLRVAALLIALALTGSPHNLLALPAQETVRAPSSARQVAAPARLSLSHTPVRAEELPFPAEMVPLKVVVEGTRDYELRLRTFAVIDGVLSEIAPAKSYVDENDHAVYEINLFAPMAELSYQFVLYGRDGTIAAASPRYSARRACVPAIEPVVVTESDDLPPAKRIVELQREANALGFELASLESALAAVSDLRSRLPKK